MGALLRALPMGALVSISALSPLPAVAAPAMLVHMCGGGAALLQIPGNRPANRGTVPCCLKDYVGRDERKRMKKEGGNE